MAGEHTLPPLFDASTSNEAMAATMTGADTARPLGPVFGLPGIDLLATLKAAEAALAEGDENCGGNADNVYHEPLQQVRAAIAAMGGAA